MAITLAEAKVTMEDKVDIAVIDEFRRSSLLLDKLTFDNCVSPGTGGSTLTYGYTRLLTPSTAAGREINSEYTANEAKRKKCSVDLKIFGGAFSVDRVIQDTSGSLNEMEFQLKEKIKAARNYFHYLVINGDSEVTSTEFDGLDAMLTGTSTEYTAAKGIDLSTSEATDANYKEFLDAFEDFLANLDGKPDMLMTSGKVLSKFQAIARRCGYFSQTEDAFGRKISAYDGIPIVDMGKYYNGSATVDVVTSYSAQVGGSTITGMFDIYAAQLGLDGFHGVSPAGGNVIKTYLPDLSKPGAVKTGEVELTCAVALKNSLKAGVFRGVKAI